MTEKKRMSGLGRGLSALLDEIQIASSSNVTPAAAEPRDTDAPEPRGPQMLPLSQIVANPKQPRRHFDPAALEELIASVRERGLLQPILVRPIGRNRYEIVAGERRWRAAQAAQLHEVPVIIRTLDDSTAFQIAIIENVQRTDLNPIEEAEGYRRLMTEFHHTQEALGKLVGKSRSHIANLLRLLSLPQPVVQLVSEGKLSMGHARALIGAPNPAALAEMVVEQGLSVRQTEALTANPAKAKAKEPKAGRTVSFQDKDSDIAALERQLSEALGLPVTVSQQGAGGSISIRYSDLDQLDMICQRLSGGRF